MPAGTLALTNNSAIITGSGTSFTTEIKVGDFIGITVGGAPYTLVVGVVTSNSQLSLNVPFNGPTSTGLAWYAIPASLKIAITQQILNDIGTVARGMIQEKANWQQIFSETGNVNVTLPDGTTWKGPAWNGIATSLSGKLDKTGGNLAGGLTGPNFIATNGKNHASIFPGSIELSDSTPFIDFHAANSTADYDSRIINNTAGRLTLASPHGSNGYANLYAGALSLYGAINFSNATHARQTLLNTGISAPGANRLIIPVTLTQAMMFTFLTTVVTTNSSGDATITFPQAYTSILNVLLTNGDGIVYAGSQQTINVLRTTGFDIRCYNNAGPQVSTVRVNYMAMGLINI